MLIYTLFDSEQTLNAMQTLTFLSPSILLHLIKPNKTYIHMLEEENFSSSAHLKFFDLYTDLYKVKAA